MATEVKVKTLQGKLWSVSAEPTDTIAQLKKKLEDKDAGPVEAQRLIFGGKILEDAKTVGEYELTKGENPAPVFLVVNPEAAKKAEEAKKAREAAAAAEAARKAAEDAKKAAEAKANDPAVIAAKIEAIAKKIGEAKSINELVGSIETELAKLKGKPAAGAAAGAAAAAKPATEWSCAACTSVNKPGRSRCEVCDTPNPDAPKGAAGGGGTGPWQCGTCTYNNAGASRACTMCQTPNPNAPAQAQPARRRSISPRGSPRARDNDGGDDGNNNEYN